MTTENRRIILIVDDSPQNQELLDAILESEGFDVINASSGPEALEAVKTHHPILILLDIMMPEMDGYEVCRRLKNNSCSRDIPVIFLTALDDRATIIKAFDTGAADFVTKPFDGHEVLARVKAHAELYLNRLTIQDYARQLKERLDRTEEDNEAGRMVQFRLLPKDVLRLGSCEFRRLLMPSMHMSGDFVDYFAIDSSRQGLYMLDVAGHGAASAFVTVLIKSSINHALSDFHAGTSDLVSDPARMLNRLNRELIDAGLDRHAAVFYAVFDRDGREMRYANGGYFPFPVLSANGTVTTIQSRSKPVGLFDDAEYATISLALPAVFEFLMFSDGVLDILPDEALTDKLARLEELVRSRITDPADIRKALKMDSVSELPDDITVLAVTRRCE